MTENVIATSENGRYRVRLVLEQDASPYNPRTDGDCNLAYVLTVPHSHYEDIQGDGGPLQEEWDRIKHRHQDDAMDLFEWRAKAHGAVVVRHTPYRGPNSLWYLMPDQFAEIGCTPEEALRAEIAEYQSWADGDVWYYVIEKNVTWAPKGDDGTDDEIPDEINTWEHVDSCGGYIGRKYAEESAREAFAYYAKKGGKA